MSIKEILTSGIGALSEKNSKSFTSVNMYKSKHFTDIQ